ncbi:hypothetical protein PDO_5269 [Rhizobium sp. PDO1-076]|nr:hypothetical protein PDO_5269 [Rhizobium sp. PDO1-076]
MLSVRLNLSPENSVRSEEMTEPSAAFFEIVIVRLPSADVCCVSLSGGEPASQLVAIDLDQCAVGIGLCDR